MTEATTKLPVKTEEKKTEGKSTALQGWRPFDSLRHEVDRLFEDFERGSLRLPFLHSAFEIAPSWRRELSWGAMPAVDISEKNDAYEVTVELPGLDEKNIDVRVANGNLTIKGEKQEEKEEKTKDRYVSERRYGSFRRSLQIPGSVDAEKIEANYKSGILTVTLPKSLEAQKKQRTIPVSAK
jgi:HSP20 family protein